MQGEGYYTGTPSFFLRTMGCDVGCVFCDTKYTWSFRSREVKHTELKEATPIHAKMTVDEILEVCGETKHIVLTGGEPCLQDLSHLTRAAIKAGKTIQVETSGTAPLSVIPGTWITLSPKFNNPGKKPILNDCIFYANEFKFPVKGVEDLTIIDDFFKSHHLNQRLVWLQPISQDEKATKVCLEEARKRGWRISVQTHKYLGLR